MRGFLLRCFLSGWGVVHFEIVDLCLFFRSTCQTPIWHPPWHSFCNLSASHYFSTYSRQFNLKIISKINLDFLWGCNQDIPGLFRWRRGVVGRRGVGGRGVFLRWRVGIGNTSSAMASYSKLHDFASNQTTTTPT